MPLASSAEPCGTRPRRCSTPTRRWRSPRWASTCNPLHTQTPRHTDDVLMFVGRLVEKKGVGDLIAAMPAILAKRPEARAVIVGHGPLEDRLKTQAAVLGVADAVSFAGHKTNQELPDILRSASLAVMPFCVAGNGDVEGLELAAVEAMGCGLPVIVGDVAAIHDVVTGRPAGSCRRRIRRHSPMRS